MFWLEGTSWQAVGQATDVVKTISAGGSGLWAVMDSVSSTSIVDGLVTALQGGSGFRGVLARRSGITPGNRAGTGWDIAIGVRGKLILANMNIFNSIGIFLLQGGWKDISVRGK